MRVESEQPFRGDCGGWLHRGGSPVPEASLVRRSPRPAFSASRPAIESQDTVYRALASVLSLSADHRRHLLEYRSLPPELLQFFASIPEVHRPERRVIAEKVARRVGCSIGELTKVPGFFRFEPFGTIELVPVPRGILVPYLDREGRVQAYQIRKDTPFPDGTRYLWLSTRGTRCPVSSGSPVGVWRPDLILDGAMITEGSLKGLVAACRLSQCVLAVAGATNWRPLLAVLRDRPGGYPITVAYDADAASNPMVWRAREDLAWALHRAGFAVSLAAWDVAYKGVDDALLAGAEVRVKPWRPSLRPPVRPQGRELPVNRPAGVPLKSTGAGS